MINSHLVALWINPFFVVNLGISVFDLLCSAKWTWFHNISICEHLCSLASVMSGSFQPHRLWLTRLDCPYDFPIKNTGMGCLPSFSSVQFSSVTQSCPILWNPMNCSTPGLPIHHQLLEFTQTLVHWVGDAIQPSHTLSSPSPAPNLSQHQGVSQRVKSSGEVAKVLAFQLQHQSFQWTPRTDLLQDGLVRFPCSPRDFQDSSPTPEFKSINVSVLSFLHSPTLTSIRDHWKNHSLD